MKALLLLSGGIDSPVAGYLMQKKGYSIVPLHFSSEPITDDASTKKCLELSKKLGFEKMITVKIGKLLAELVNKCNHRLYYVLQRRMMLRIAEKVAKEHNCDSLITGDNLGQVGSQTLSNMVNITKAVSMPVHRPLLGFDKLEIIRVAEKIGTFELSKGPEICCEPR